jgi:hypothetical protein
MTESACCQVWLETAIENSANRRSGYRDNAERRAEMGIASHRGNDSA